MSEHSAKPQQELKRLTDSLRETSSEVRAWAARTRSEMGDSENLLSRQLDRAAQFLDSAVRAFRGQVGDQDSLAAAGVPGLTGSTEAIPLSSVVSFLAGIDISGVLRIYAPDEHYTLQFEQGDLIYAQGDNPPEGLRLGEVLVSQGAIHRADLLRVLDTGWSPEDTLGSLLVRQGYIDPQQLQGALEYQIQALGSRLFANAATRFRFYPDERVIDHEDVRINVMGLLLESARVMDEAERPDDAVAWEAA